MNIQPHTATNRTMTSKTARNQTRGQRGRQLTNYLGYHVTLCVQVEAEDDMKASRQARQQQQSGQIAGLKEQIRRMEAEVRRSQQEAAAARLQ